ncbi:hypothetical protein D1AOALGA4SA_9458 [Olavius algarvensis Delta 1 endosymbiont]|nr:hypothetical protein D1AOALGA4SA_9458 [Olavius algarvensis Delta 1 endosymbiont]
MDPLIPHSLNLAQLNAIKHRSYPKINPFKGFRCSARGGPPAKKRTSLIVKETLKKANIEYRTRNNECRSKVFCRFKFS